MSKGPSTFGDEEPVKPPELFQSILDREQFEKERAGATSSKWTDDNVPDEKGVHRVAQPRAEAYRSKDERRSDPAQVLADVTGGGGGGGEADSRKPWKYGREIASHAEGVDWARRRRLVSPAGEVPSGESLGAGAATKTEPRKTLTADGLGDHSDDLFGWLTKNPVGSSDQ